MVFKFFAIGIIIIIIIYLKNYNIIYLIYNFFRGQFSSFLCHFLGFPLFLFCKFKPFFFGKNLPTQFNKTFLIFFNLKKNTVFAMC